MVCVDDAVTQWTCLFFEVNYESLCEYYYMHNMTTDN